MISKFANAQTIMIFVTAHKQKQAERNEIAERCDPPFHTDTESWSQAHSSLIEFAELTIMQLYAFLERSRVDRGELRSISQQRGRLRSAQRSHRQLRQPK